jgi:hypothetical protein
MLSLGVGMYVYDDMRMGWGGCGLYIKLYHEIVRWENVIWIYISESGITIP